MLNGETIRLDGAIRMQPPYGDERGVRESKLCQAGIGPGETGRD